MTCVYVSYFFFFFNDTATTEIYTLSLHDGSSDLKNFDDERILSYFSRRRASRRAPCDAGACLLRRHGLLRHRLSRQLSALHGADRKSTRLNSSHLVISYAVFCLKKKNHVTKSVFA